MSSKLRFVSNILFGLVFFAIFTSTLLIHDPFDDTEEEMDPAGRAGTAPTSTLTDAQKLTAADATPGQNTKDLAPGNGPTNSTEDLSFNGWDVSKACWDPKGKKEYAVDSIWTTGGCEYFHCMRLTLGRVRSQQIAVAVEKNCIVPDNAAQYCAQLPKNNASYPECCPLEVCILGNMINVTGTTPDGTRFNISQLVSNQDMTQITKLSRTDLFRYALGVHGLNNSKDRQKKNKHRYF